MRPEPAVNTTLAASSAGSPDAVREDPAREVDGTALAAVETALAALRVGEFATRLPVRNDAFARNIAQVATAVARGDLSQKITVDAQGEILELKNTVNTMVDQLSSFAEKVTRVAWEVGTEGRLGGQAEVAGVSGTWRDLTENVNQVAGNLTTQVRAIAEVSTAVTRGDLTRSITVEAHGEVAELKNTINQMIAELRETTEKNAQTDWLRSNLARIGGQMHGPRDLQALCTMLMSEMTEVVAARQRGFLPYGECAQWDAAAANDLFLRLWRRAAGVRHR
jgi:HAMP domain-containing protein